MEALHGSRGAGLVLRVILIAAAIAVTLVLFRGFLAVAIAEAAAGLCRSFGLCS